MLPCALSSRESIRSRTDFRPRLSSSILTDEKNGIVSPEELEEIAHTYKRIAGFDPDTLKSRLSLSVR